MARILIVDDNEGFRKLLRAALRQKGHVVEEVADGEAGLRAVRADPPDLIVLDLYMPRTDGLGVLRTLRRESIRIPVIAVSGGAQTGELFGLDLAERLGAVATFLKPFPMKDFLDAVQAAVGPG